MAETSGVKPDEMKAVDTSNKKEAIEFLLSNSAHLLVSELLDAVDASQQMMTDLVKAVNSHTYGDWQAGIIAAAKSVKQAEASNAASNTLIDSLKEKIANQESKLDNFAELASQFDELKNELLSLKKQKAEEVTASQPINPIINIQPPTPNIFQNTNLLQPPTNNRSGTSSPNGSGIWVQGSNHGDGNAKPDGSAKSDPVNDLFNMIHQLTTSINNMGQQQEQMSAELYSRSKRSVEADNKRPKINGIRPPKFNVGEHRSLRLFAMSEFARWAGDQGLTESWSTLWFCQSFSGKEDLDTVYRLALKPDGTPRYKFISDLVEQIIVDLCVNEETEKELRRIYGNYKWNSKRSIEQNFKWICEQRRLGWPNEDAEEALVLIKELFMSELPQSSQFHSTVHTELKFGVKWDDCINNYQCQKLLRELQSRFYKDPQSSYYLSNSNKSPTNNHSAAEKMDINNVDKDVQNIGKDYYKNPDDEVKKNTSNNSNSRFPPSRTKKQVNSVEEKECANPKCDTVFKPRFSHFYCCTSKCAREMPQRQRKKELNAIDKAINSAHAEPREDDNVSSVFFITPTHVYAPGSDIPVVVHDALFDTGAGPTLVTTSTLKFLKLSHLIKPKQDDGFKAGDKRPMVGNIGTIEMDIGVEDSSVYVTDRFKMVFEVFEDLNHKFIIGRNSMVKGIRKIEIFPLLNTILFNPSLKKSATYNKKLAKRLAVSGNINNFKSAPCIAAGADILRKPVDPNSRFET